MIYTTLLNIAIFQGMVLGLLLIKTSLFNSKSNKYLAYLLFTLSLILLTHIFEVEELFVPYPILHFVENIQWVFLIPPFLYLFITHRVDKPIKNKPKRYMYFIPFLFSALLNVTVDLDFVIGVYTLSEQAITIVSLLGLIQLILAIIFIPYLLFHTYFMLRHIKEPKEKKWMMSLVTLISLVLFSWLITCLIGLFIQYDTSSTMNIVALLATLIVHWIAYVGIYRYKLATDQEAIYNFLHKNFPFSDNNAPEENKESITIDNPYFQKLERLCKEQHIYTDTTLNREKVAEKLGISAGYLSLIVNSITGDNFANYINQYRVEAVKEMISNVEYENYNLLAMGLESGFTSKTTFYKAFKKITGQTPNAYKNTPK